jgi:hypothetical protein
MIDRYEYIHKRNILYGVYVGDFSDTIKLIRIEVFGLKVKFQVISINTLVRIQIQIKHMVALVHKAALCELLHLQKNPS